jgi:D-serine deaminase-like pyridoxal phosphate-dependent protein
MQMAAGGTVSGITTSTLGQAEVFAANGFSDIFVANVIVTPPKIRRLCALARRVKVTVAVDSSKNVADLSAAAAASSVTVNVVVNINSRPTFAGVEPGAPAVELARLASEWDGLSFAGLMTYEGPILADGDGELAAESRRWIQRALDTREQVERAGIGVDVVSVGGTHNYEIAGEMAGVTEIPAGSYALMDEKYRTHRSQFANAARVMSCVTSTPEAGEIVTDAGRKAVGGDAGNPSVEGLPGAEVRGLSAEHGTVDFDPAVDHRLKLGDRVWFIPRDIAGSVNVHDYIHAIRDGKLEAVWELPARGRYR